MTLEVSSTHQQKMDQLSAAFRSVAEVLGELREQLIEKGFTKAGAENVTELFATKWLDNE